MWVIVVAAFLAAFPSLVCISLSVCVSNQYFRWSNILPLLSSFYFADMYFTAASGSIALQQHLGPKCNALCDCAFVHISFANPGSSHSSVPVRACVCVCDFLRAQFTAFVTCLHDLCVVFFLALCLSSPNASDAS